MVSSTFILFFLPVIYLIVFLKDSRPALLCREFIHTMTVIDLFRL